MLATWGCTTFPKPTLSLDFLGATSLDSGITFSRGSQATLFDSTGTLRYAKHNLLLQSQTFQTTWAVTRASIGTDATTAPDGTSTADKLIEDSTASNSHFIDQTITFLAGISYTYTIYAKNSERRYFQLILTSPAFGANIVGVFDLVSGISTQNAGSSSITDVGNGWYRCSLTATSTAASGATVQVRLANSYTTTPASYTGDGTSGIFIWGAQLNIANMEGGVTSSLTTYYPTTTAAYYAPRFDYNPSTLQPRGLLIEEQRTNGIRNNTMQGAVAGTPGTLPTNWALAGASGLTQTVVGTGTENGINYVDVRYAGTSSATFTVIYFETATQVAATSGQTWTNSSYASLVGGSTANVTSVVIGMDELSAVGGFLAGSNSSFTLSAGSLNSRRFSHTRTLTNASTAFVRPFVFFTYANGAAIDITLRIGLPQLEQGAFATSVIPTTTTALTRNADVASMTGTNFSSWYSASEGTLFAQAQPLRAPLTAAGIPFAVRATNNEIALRFRPTQKGGASVVDTSVTQVDTSSSGNYTTSVNKLAFAYKVNNFASSLNGEAAVTDNIGTVPTVDSANIGSLGGTVNWINGWVSRVTYYPTRLPDATLVALTA